ncbi:hypothetical protein BKA82DRAFT_4084688 [Pisolithus tinctorius]|nr:hypothetical protein BKA82DRAFT_4084688 [Pisolithus tinctorius]
MSDKPLRDAVRRLKFRVLIIGRANAGKTSILQRVCETTESPKIYRVSGGRREEVHLDPTIECGNHDIEDELIFTNHEGYVFHDSCGFEAGNEDELRAVQDFVHRKVTERRLRDRLHAIWYCIPMESARPGLDMKFFDAVCSDKNVPVIAVFTKYDQFKLDVQMELEDRSEGNATPTLEDINEEAEKIFQDEYWNVIKGSSPKYARLENMHEPGASCSALIIETANALHEDVLRHMLVAVQRENLMISNEMEHYLTCCRTSFESDGRSIVESCMGYFPHLWLVSDLIVLDSHGCLAIAALQACAGVSWLPCHCCSSALCWTLMIGLDLHDPHKLHHVLIVSTLIFESASIIFLSSAVSLHEALQQSCCRFDSLYSNIQSVFPLSSDQDHTNDYLAFVLEHRLVPFSGQVQRPYTGC